MSALKYICLTDTHLNKDNIEENINIYKQAVDYAHAHGVKTILHLGDIFDSRKAQPLSVLKAFSDILQMFKKASIKLVAIPGNHDKNDYNSEDSYLDIFTADCFIVYKKFGVIVDDEVNIAMLPFFNEKESYMQYFNSLIDYLHKEKISLKKTLLLTHVAITGVKNNDGSVVENEIGINLFSEFKKVLVGHYHNRSSLKPNIIYIGSAMQHNFGEDYDKGFTLIFENGGISFKQSEFKKFKKYSVNIDDYTPAELEKHINELNNENENVRVIINGEYEKINAINVEKFKNNGVDIKLKASEIDVNVEKIQKSEFTSFNSATIKEEFAEFCKENSLDIEKGNSYLKIINI